MRTPVCIGAAVLVTLAATAFAVADESGKAAAGLKRYVDAASGFSFWYPASLHVAASKSRDSKSFPGGVVVETLQVGEPGGVVLHVVDSPRHSITDEPNGHAAPIAQTRYLYSAASRRWMIAYPEGGDDGKPKPPGPADVSSKTIGRLPMLPSGARFDTTIIPLSTTRFVVVQDGGGSAFTTELARTVAPAGAHIDAAAQAAALKAEAAAATR